MDKDIAYLIKLTWYGQKKKNIFYMTTRFGVRLLEEKSTRKQSLIDNCV
jgi:hypothetical protein